MTGNMNVQGSQGNVHANGDITGGGSASVTGNITATGTQSPMAFHPDGAQGGGFPTIPVPEIKASDYLGIGRLDSDRHRHRSWSRAACLGAARKAGPACPTGWTYSGGGTGAHRDRCRRPRPTTCRASATIHGTGKSILHRDLGHRGGQHHASTATASSSPRTDSKIQFVTNGDFELLGNADADDPTDMDGQILVREQMKITATRNSRAASWSRIEDGATNAWNASTNQGRRGASTLSANELDGNMTVTYNGSLGDIVTTIVTTSTTITPTTSQDGSSSNAFGSKAVRGRGDDADCRLGAGAVAGDVARQEEARRVRCEEGSQDIVECQPSSGRNFTTVGGRDDGIVLHEHQLKRCVSADEMLVQSRDNVVEGEKQSKEDDWRHSADLVRGPLLHLHEELDAISATATDEADRLASGTPQRGL